MVSIRQSSTAHLCRYYTTPMAHLIFWCGGMIIDLYSDVDLIVASKGFP